jgi:hypothetical protein
MRWRLGLVVLAVAAALTPLPPSLVETFYSRRVYAEWQPFVTRFSNAVPLSWLDVLVVLTVVSWVFLVGRDIVSRRSRGRGATVLRIVMRTATLAAAAYLAFLLGWGLNYRRTPLAETLSYDEGRITSQAARALAEESVERVNALYDASHRETARDLGAIRQTLSVPFTHAQRELGIPANFIPGRPKRSLFDPYFQRAGVAGMTDPYLLETLIASDLVDVERPMVLAHEWSHLAGIADEGDANFAGWLTCLRGSPFHQYSAWLFLYGETVGALDGNGRRAVSAKLGDGPRADLQAIRNRLLRHINPTVSAVGWRVYDGYLKANRVEQGTASYERVVRLILGTNFDDDYVPRLR